VKQITREEAAELMQAATPGPWVVRGSVSYDGPTCSVRAGYAESSYPITSTLPSDRPAPDAALIAAAPALASTVVALHDRIAELEATLAAERGDPAGALPGWQRMATHGWCRASDANCVLAVRFGGDVVYWVSDHDGARSRYPTAREAMRAADAAVTP
jgi:hypothetical protein